MRHFLHAICLLPIRMATLSFTTPLIAAASLSLGLPPRRCARLGRSYALIGGLAVSVRGEIRFTRDVDLVVLVRDDADAEKLIFDLRSEGYTPVATVEHPRHHRLATARLASPNAVVVDLMFANCGIEPEVIDRSTTVHLPAVGNIPVASSEELVAMKVLSMTDARLQDRLDAQQLLKHGTVDLERDLLRRPDEALGRLAARGAQG